LDQFFDKVDEFIAFVKSAKPAPGFTEILLPGDHARATETRRITDGVELDDETWTELEELAAELGVRNLLTSH
jgi:uncharacterized oxidoreductase